MPEEDLNSKDAVWVPQSEGAFVKGTIVHSAGDTVTVRTETGEELTVAKASLQRCNPPKFDQCDDMAELTHLNEPSVVHNLRQRYANDLIYTYSGLFLVAINPYRPLDLYEENYVHMYHGGDLGFLKPHIFAITERTYQNMLTKHRNQSILVTGESGAGKTENTKKIIQYLSSITSAHSLIGSGIEEKILQANPILESFGNAQTIRNNNSSRFGKFIRIEFAASQIVGAHIEWYLLEKSRVLKQSAHERNYHIFYQLLAGLGKAQQTELGLSGRAARDFAYLRESNHTIPHVDDKAEFQHLLNSFKIMGFKEEEVAAIFRALALILHLGNLDFASTKAEQALFASTSPLTLVSHLAGFASDAFSTAVLRPRVKAGKEFVTKSQSPAQARATIDAVAKMLYERLFRFIVDKINTELVVDGQTSAATNFIGVLDIAGFEIFTKNSFEQLCINYTNERLQQFFNHNMFILEQNEYLKENINWKFIDFGNDLQPTIDLIDARGKNHGVMAMLDEECIVPRATDQSFLDKLVSKWGSQAGPGSKFSQNKFKTGFIVHHYAGKVDYNVDQWLEKNREPVSEAVVGLLAASTEDFVAALFATTELVSNGSRNNMLRTVGSKHKEQLLSLMDQLGNTTPHFVRCILPNNAKKPKQFETRLVLEQLRCNGVLEGIRIARAGYPNRILFEEFLPRYTLLYPGSNTFANAKVGCELILANLGLDAELFKVGLTKIFFKNGVLADLEIRREEALKAIIVGFQALARGKMKRRSLQREIRRMQAGQVVTRNFKAYTSLAADPWFALYCAVKPTMASSIQIGETKKFTEKIAQLESLVAEMQGAKSEVEREKEALAGEISSLNAVLTQERDLLAKKDGVVTRLQAREIEIEGIITTQTKELTALQKSNMELKEVAEARLEDAREWEAKITEQTNAVTLLAQEKAAIFAQFEDAATRSSELHSSKAEAERSMNQLQSELGSLRSTLTFKEAEIKGLSRKMADATKGRQTDVAVAVAQQLEGARASATASDAALAAKEREISSLNRSINDQKRSLLAIEQEKRQLQGDLLVLTKDLKSTRGVLEALQAKHLQLQATAAEAAGALREKEGEVVVIQASQEAREQELEKLKKQLLQVESQRDKELTEKENLHNELRMLQGQYEQLSALKENSDAKLADLSYQIADLKKSSLPVSGRSFLGTDNQLMVDYAEIRLRLNEQAAILKSEKVENRRLNEEVYALKTKLAAEAYENRKLKQPSGLEEAGEWNRNSGLSREPVASDTVGLGRQLREQKTLNMQFELQNMGLQTELNELRAKLKTQTDQVLKVSSKENVMRDVGPRDSMSKLNRHSIYVTEGMSLSRTSSLSRGQLRLQGLEAKTADLTAQVQLYKSRADEYYSQVEAAEMMVRTAQRSEAFAAQELRDVGQELAETRAALGAKNAAMADLQRTVAALEEEAQKRSVSLSERERAAAALQKELNYYKDHNVSSTSDFHQEIKELRQELSDKLAVEAVAARETKRLTLSLEAALAEAQASRVELQLRKKDKNTMEKFANELLNKNLSLQAAMSELEARLAASQRQAMVAEESLVEVSKERDALLESKRLLETRMRSVNEEYQAYVTEASDKHATLALLQESLKKSQRELHTVRTELRVAEGSASVNLEALTLLERESKLTLEENAALAKVKAALEAKVQKLESALYDANKNEFWETQVAELKTQLREEKATKLAQSQRCHELEREVKHASIQMQNQEQMAKKYHEENLTVSQKLAALTSELQVLRSDEAAARLLSQRAERQAEDLREHSLKLEKEVLEWQERFGALEDEEELEELEV